MSNLLSNLSALTSLCDLEIDQLVIATKLDLTFHSLELLSIYLIVPAELVKQPGRSFSTEAVQQFGKLLRINAANLTHIHFGE